MNKPSVVISCPLDTYSGYGARARDFIKALYATNSYDIKILSQRWGNTRFGYLDDHNETVLKDLILTNLNYQPDIWIQVTVPNEFQKVGRYNIGLTAGIETTVADASWIEGCNRMDLILTSSEHSKNTFVNSSFDAVDKNTEQVLGRIALETPVEVLFEGADITKYFPTGSSKNSTLVTSIDTIKESFCFLFVGHWLPGDFGQDRKNIGYTVKAFLETFKNKPNPPALILKTHQGTSSIMDREDVLKKIDSVRKTVKGSLPNVYLLHGDISDSEMNELYNHTKVKCMVCLTKGEGFGRPLLEFSLVNKPIIASGWSGQVDFLDKNLCILVGGQLQDVHTSALMEKAIIQGAKWFTPDDQAVNLAFKNVYKDYKNFLTPAKKLGYRNRNEFSLESMKERLQDIFKRNIPEFPSQIELKLPKLELPPLQTVK